MGLESKGINKEAGKEPSVPPQESVYERADRLRAFSTPWTPIFEEILWGMEDFKMSLAGHLDRASGDLTKLLYEDTGGDSSQVTRDKILETFKKLRPALVADIEEFKTSGK